MSIRRGQVNSIDALVAIVVFVLCMTFILSFWSTTIATRAELIKRSRFEYAAISASDALAKSAGVPCDWEYNASSARMIGLATAPNVLSPTKLSNLTAISYAALKGKLGIDSDFYLYVEYQNGTRVYEAGNLLTAGSQVAAVQRFCLLGNESVKMVFLVYLSDNGFTLIRTTDGAYAVDKFTGVGSTIWIAPAGVTSVDYLVVAGGGGGGNTRGGGGGAGGMLNATGLAVTPGKGYVVEVGDGGNGGGYAKPGYNGANSTFSTITSRGGGGGGSGWFVGTGRTGGSGGGSAVSFTPGNGIAGQGNSGGNGGGGYTGGGGGGRGGAGRNGTVGGNGGAGGNGTASNITGTSITYCGGGGGGTYYIGMVGGAGGTGGGGAGGITSEGFPGTDGLGGGGGGGGQLYESFNGGKGGSGVVILRYLKP